MPKSPEVDTSLGGVAKILISIKKKEEKRKKKVKESMIGNKVEQVIDVSAGVVMKYGDNNERLVLMIQRSKDDHWPLHWEFPRGKCDKPIGEDTKKCIVREVKEETGLDVEPMTLLGIFEYMADGGKRKSICHNYLCKVLNPDQKVKLSKEHSDFKWVSEAGEVQLLILPDQLKVLQKVLNPERKIMNIPDNSFSQNDSVEEYLGVIQR